MGLFFTKIVEMIPPLEWMNYTDVNVLYLVPKFYGEKHLYTSIAIFIHRVGVAVLLLYQYVYRYRLLYVDKHLVKQRTSQLKPSESYAVWRSCNVQYMQCAVQQEYF